MTASNIALDLPARPVTALAQDASAAPVRSAGQRNRYAVEVWTNGEEAKCRRRKA